jgi:hypothetical protein
VIKRKYSKIKYSEKELERLRDRWKTEEGKERRRKIIEIIKSGSSDFGDYAIFPEYKDNKSQSIPPGKDLRGINLASIEIPQGLNFSRFYLSGANLEVTDLSSVNFSFAHLEYTSFNGTVLNRTIFKSAHLVRTSFIGANLDNVILSEAIIEGYPLGSHRMFMEDGFKDFSSSYGFIDKRSVFYNLIKTKYKHLGKYDEMIPFHTMEMRAKRDEKFIKEKEILEDQKIVIKRKKTLLWYSEKIFFDICFGYGEKWYRVFITAMCIVLLFSFLYMFSAPLKSNWGPEITTSLWLDNLYFSAVNFTNLGSQDWLPGCAAHRVMMSMESITGLFLITLIIVIFTRKMIRE